MLGGLVIPALAFNDAKASINTNLDVVSHALAKMLPTIHEVEALTEKRCFASKTSVISLNGLLLTAASHSPLRIQRSDSLGYNLWVPTHGSKITSRTRKGEWDFGSGVSGFLCACEDRTTLTDTISEVNLRLNPIKLEAAYKGMVGLDRIWHFESNSRTPLFNVGGISFDELFRSLFKQINAADGNEETLTKLAIDDSFYRLAIGFLHPEVFLETETHNGKRPYVRPEITKLCEFLAANLTQPLALTQMEEMSGLSARVLQRSFQKAFGLRPKQWVRKQRLHAARSAMLKPNEHTTITSIAYDFCFASPSEFARHYLAEFGELPSQTLTRK